jgi:hypothetical protein
MRYAFLIFLLVSLKGFTQHKSYIIGVRGDTLNVVDKNGLKQGRWVNTFPPLRGEPGYEEQGVYINDKKEGQWQRFSLMGDLLAMENYRWGNKSGKCYYFNRWGAMEREESWKAVNPDNPYDTIPVYDLHDPTKIVDRVVIKLEGSALRHGLWKYYDPEFGTIVKTEEYWLDKHKNALDDLAPLDVSSNGKARSDTTTARSAAKPKVIQDWEKKNSGKKSIKVRDGRTGG